MPRGLVQQRPTCDRKSVEKHHPLTTRATPFSNRPQRAPRKQAPLYESSAKMPLVSSGPSSLSWAPALVVCSSAGQRETHAGGCSRRGSCGHDVTPRCSAAFLLLWEPHGELPSAEGSVWKVGLTHGGHTCLRTSEIQSRALLNPKSSCVWATMLASHTKLNLRTGRHSLQWPPNREVSWALTGQGRKRNATVHCPRALAGSGSFQKVGSFVSCAVALLGGGGPA